MFNNDKITKKKKKEKKDEKNFKKTKNIHLQKIQPKIQQ